MRNLIAFSMVVAAVGCDGSAPGTRAAPVSVTGKVSHAGQPVGNVAVSFQPLDNGHMKSLPVEPDGTFQGELLRGKYAYSIMASSSPDSQQALSKVAPQFREPNLERTVQIEPGQELQIMLD
jgi:hypothetical protein